MVDQLVHLDLGSIRDFQSLIEDVEVHGISVMLTRHDKAVAVIKPAPRTRGRRATRPEKAPVGDDALLSLIGMLGPDEGPTDVSANKDRYLAQAYSLHSQ